MASLQLYVMAQPNAYNHILFLRDVFKLFLQMKLWRYVLTSTGLVLSLPHLHAHKHLPPIQHDPSRSWVTTMK